MISARAAYAPAVFAVVVERDIVKVVPVVIRQVSFERFSHAFLPLSVVMIFSTFCAENKKTPLLMQRCFFSE